MSIAPMRMYLIALNGVAGEKGQGMARIEMRDGHGAIEVNARNMTPHTKGEYRAIVIWRGGLSDAGALKQNAQGYHLKTPVTGVHGEILGVMIALVSIKGSLHVILSGLVSGQRPEVLRWAEEQARMRWGMGAPREAKPPSVHGPQTPRELDPEMHEPESREPIWIKPSEPKLVNARPGAQSGGAENRPRDMQSQPKSRDMQNQPKSRDMQSQPKSRDMQSQPKSRDMQCKPQPPQIMEVSAPDDGDFLAKSNADDDVKIWNKAEKSVAPNKMRCAPSEAPEDEAVEVTAAEAAMPEAAAVEAAAFPGTRPHAMNQQRGVPFPGYSADGRSAGAQWRRESALDDIILGSQIMPQPAQDPELYYESAPRARERGQDYDNHDEPTRGAEPLRYPTEIIRDNAGENTYYPGAEKQEMDNPFDRLRRGRPSARRMVPNPFEQLYPNTRWVMVQYPGMYSPYYLASELMMGDRKLWAAAVPGEFDTTPPPWLPGFLRFRKARGGQGYWVALQDPETGEFVHDDR